MELWAYDVVGSQLVAVIERNFQEGSGNDCLVKNSRSPVFRLDNFFNSWGVGQSGRSGTGQSNFQAGFRCLVRNSFLINVCESEK